MRRILYKNKKGTYLYRVWRRTSGPVLAMVRFDGNKCPSRVPRDDLEFITESVYKGKPEQGNFYWTEQN